MKGRGHVAPDPASLFSPVFVGGHRKSGGFDIVGGFF